MLLGRLGLLEGLPKGLQEHRHQATADTHRKQPKAAPGEHLLDILKESEQRGEHLALERHKTVFY